MKEYRKKWYLKNKLTIMTTVPTAQDIAKAVKTPTTLSIIALSVSGATEVSTTIVAQLSLAMHHQNRNLPDVFRDFWFLFQGL